MSIASVSDIEMVNLGPARGPKRAETGLIIFLFKRFLFIVLGALGNNKGIMNCYNWNVLCIKQIYYISTKIFTYKANGLSKFN